MEDPRTKIQAPGKHQDPNAQESSWCLLELPDFSALEDADDAIGGQGHETEREQAKSEKSGPQECESRDDGQKTECAADEFRNSAQQADMCDALHMSNKLFVVLLCVPLCAGVAAVALELRRVAAIEALRAELGKNKVRFRGVVAALAVGTIIIALRNAIVVKDGFTNPAPGRIGFESYVLTAD
jgi:hypothetical protein